MPDTNEVELDPDNPEEWAGNSNHGGADAGGGGNAGNGPRRLSYQLNNSMGGAMEALGHASLTDTQAGAEEDEGPSRLFSILEEAVPRPNEETDIQNRRELVEHTWDLVRRWLWAHPNAEDRAAAAYIRGQANATPLHLMCKVRHNGVWNFILFENC